MSVQYWLDQAAEYFEEQWGLNSSLAMKISQLYLWGLLSGFPMSVTSGWRDPEKQRALQERWDRGDRSGLAARPATNSKHSTTTFFGSPDAMAVDLYAGNQQNLRTLGYWAEEFLGLNWGGSFKNADLVHFYI